VQQLLGCDWLIYQDLADLEDAVSGPKHKLTGFDSSCFDGKYVTGIEPGYLEGLQAARSDETKLKRAS
jgi:amidophosphoribosyltransferase